MYTTATALIQGVRPEQKQT